MRRDARRALGLGAALVATASVGAARADVFPIELNACSAGCASPAADEPASAGHVALSLIGREGAWDTDGRHPELIFDSRTLPAVLVDGPPSPIVSISAQALDGPGSPYAFFETVIDVPLLAEAGAFTAVPLFLFAPSVRSQLNDFLWASNDFFGRPSGDIAARRGLPLSADAETLTGRLTAGWRMRTPVVPTPSSVPAPAPPSSSAPGLFGQAGDQAGPSLDFSSDGTGLK